MSLDVDGEQEPARLIGAALRSARKRSGRKVSEIAARFRGASDSPNFSYLYDAEKGRRFASVGLVRAYAEVCDEPGLVALREEVVESTQGVARPSEQSALNRIGPYAVLDALRARLARSTTEIDDELPTFWQDKILNFEPEMREPIICSGRRDSALLVARLIALAARDKQITDNRVIVVSSEEDAEYVAAGDVDVQESSLGLFRGTLLFSCIVECLLSRGTTVIHVRPSASSNAAEHGQVNALVKLLGFRGDYVPKDLDIKSPVPSHYILVPGFAAVHFMATRSDVCDAAMIVPKGCTGQYDLMASHIELLARRATEVVRIIARGADPKDRRDGADVAQTEVELLHSSRDLEGRLLEIERTRGSSILVKDGLSTVTCPTSQIAERRSRFLKSRAESTARLSTELHAFYTGRRDAFLNGLLSFKHTHVVTRESLRTYIRTGVFFRPGRPSTVDDYLALDNPTYAERAQHLRFVMSDLRDYSNYELLIVDEDDVEDIGGSGWQIKYGSGAPFSAFFESIRTRERKRGGVESSFSACEISHRPLLRHVMDYAMREVERLRSKSGSDALTAVDELKCYAVTCELLGLGADLGGDFWPSLVDSRKETIYRMVVELADSDTQDLCKKLRASVGDALAAGADGSEAFDHELRSWSLSLRAHSANGWEQALSSLADFVACETV